MKYLVASRYLTYITVFVFSLATNKGSVFEGVAFTALFLIVLISSSLRIGALSNRQRMVVLTIFIEIVTIIVMYKYLNSSVIAFLFIIVVDVHLFFDLKRALCMDSIIFAATMVCSIQFNSNIRLTDIAMNCLANAVMMSFFAASSYVINREQHMKIEVQALYEELKASKEELEFANKKLQQYSEKVEEMTVLSERNRLAGEIHDNAGHKLTALIMELDICGKLIDRDKEKTKNELEKAAQLARDTLSEIRKSVREIMPAKLEELTGVSAIKQLIREFEKNTKIPVKLNLSDNRYRLSPTVDVTIYRTIQEALTNCAKYGQAKIITVDLIFKQSCILLNIKDDGKGTVEFIKGVGLSTMEERIHYLGGTIDFDGNEGFGINAIIPVEV